MNNPYQQGGFLPPNQYGGHHQAQYMGGNQGQSNYGGHMNSGYQQAYTTTGKNPAVEGDKGKKGLITPILIKWLQVIVKNRMDDALVLQNYPIDQVGLTISSL